MLCFNLWRDAVVLGVKRHRYTRADMNKLIGFFFLSFLFLATIFGPSWVEARLEQPTDYSALATDTLLPDDGYGVQPIHPAWQRLGIFPSCLD